MPELRPDSRTRLAVDELSGVSLAGGPARALATDAATGAESELAPAGDGTFRVPCGSVPALVTLRWEMCGAEVTAEAEVVAARSCTLAEIVGYRPDYELKSTEREVFEARARAEGAIESALGRFIQPVMRRGRVARPTCIGQSPLTLVVGEGGYVCDLVRVASVRRRSGAAAELPVVPGSSRVDASGLGYGETAEVCYVAGMRLTGEASSAVAALASWYLAPKTAPENATSTSTDLGVLSFVVAGVGSAPTSLPEVNAFIQRHRMAGLGVG